MKGITSSACSFINTLTSKASICLLTLSYVLIMLKDYTILVLSLLVTMSHLSLQYPCLALFYMARASLLFMISGS